MDQKLIIGLLVAAVLALGGTTLFLLGRQSAQPAAGIPAPASQERPSPPASVADNGAVSVATAGPIERRVGACVDTTVQAKEFYFPDTPGTGFTISYANGIIHGVREPDTQPAAALEATRTGDPVKLCVVEIPPPDCPPEDDRGWVYRAENKRTGGVWIGADDPHSCGGA